VFLVIFGSTSALPSTLQDVISIAEEMDARGEFDSPKRVAREANGMYLLSFKQPSCTFDEADKKKSDEECRTELGLPKKEDTSTEKGVELELLASDRPADESTTETPAQESGFFKKAWKKIKEKASEFYETMKNLWNDLKAKIMKMFSSDDATQAGEANKYMELEQCVAKKMSLVDSEGYPAVDSMIALVKKTVKPTGKELSSGNTQRMKDCVSQSITNAKETPAATDSPFACLKDAACNANYKAANCMKVAMMEHCMSVGTSSGDNETTGGGTSKEATEGPEKNRQSPAKLTDKTK